MANHKSAIKRIKQTAKRNTINAARKSRVRTFVRDFESKLSAGSKQDAAQAFKIAESELMKSVSRGVIAKNAASRKISRLAARLNAI